MKKKVKILWNDAEKFSKLTDVEKTLLKKFEDRVENGILLNRNGKVYVVGWNSGDIVFIDCENGKQFAKLSGKNII